MAHVYDQLRLVHEAAMQMNVTFTLLQEKPRVAAGQLAKTINICGDVTSSGYVIVQP